MENHDLSSTIMILFDDETNLLLQLRDADAPTDPNQWAFFGGGLERGESPREGVLREAFEELRYEPADVIHFLTRRQNHPRFPVEHVFLSRISNEEVAGLELHEGADMGFFGVEDLDALDMAEHKKHVFRLAVSYVRDSDNPWSKENGF